MTVLEHMREASRHLRKAAKLSEDTYVTNCIIRDCDFALGCGIAVENHRLQALVNPERNPWDKK
jgi:hypothetical protein